MKTKKRESLMTSGRCSRNSSEDNMVLMVTMDMDITSILTTDTHSVQEANLPAKINAKEEDTNITRRSGGSQLYLEVNPNNISPLLSKMKTSGLWIHTRNTPMSTEYLKKSSNRSSQPSDAKNYPNVLAIPLKNTGSLLVTT